MTWVAIEVSSIDADRMQIDDPTTIGWGGWGPDVDTCRWITDEDKTADVMGMRVMPEGWSPYTEEETHG